MDIFNESKSSSNDVSVNSFVSSDKPQLAGIISYAHPKSHPASIIDEDPNHRFVTDNQILNWDSKFGTNGGVISGDIDIGGGLVISKDILPTKNGVQNIGSSLNRFKAIYVDEAYLSTNTLYLGDTPILGTTMDTIQMKADQNQSITINTTGTGQSKMISQNGVELSTSGMNADVKIQATGQGSRTVVSATNEVNFSASQIRILGNTSITGGAFIDDLTVKGSLIVQGLTTVIESQNLAIKDNVIVINNGEIGNGVTSGYAGIKIDRGEYNDFMMIFDESDGMFKIGENGDTQAIATRPYVDKKINEEILISLSSKADINSPTLIGTPIAPTATVETNTSQIATTSFVHNVVNSIKNASTTDKGLVQLNNTLTSTSTTTALTASQGKNLKDLIDTKQNSLPIENRRSITISSFDPTGGSNGDIWMKY